MGAGVTILGFSRVGLMVWAVAAFSMSVSGMSAAWGVGGAGSGRFAQVGTGVCRGVRVASLGIPKNGKTVLQVGLVSVLGVEVGRSLLEVGSGLVPVWGGSVMIHDTHGTCRASLGKSVQSCTPLATPGMPVDSAKTG